MLVESPFLLMSLFIYARFKIKLLYLYLLRVAITKNAKQRYTSNHITTDEDYSRNASYALNS